MTRNQRALKKLKPKKGRELTFGDSDKHKIIFVGKVSFETYTIKNMLFTENLRYNLLIISRLYDKGYKVTLSQTIAW